MLKKISLLAAGVLFAAVMVLNIQNPSSLNTSPVSLQMIMQDAQANTGETGEVTCYSTFLFWPVPTSIRDCADCLNFYFVVATDPGTCTVPS